VGLTL